MNKPHNISKRNTLTIGSTLRPNRLLDYWATNPKTHEMEINRYMMSSLLWTNNEGNQLPMLSENIPNIKDGTYFIEINEDNNPLSSTVKFKIRDNATWSDGEMITSEDVEFWLEIKKYDKTGINNKEPWKNASIKIINNLEFEIKFEPFYLFANTNPGPNIAPKHIIGALWEEYKRKVEQISDTILINNIWEEFLNNFTIPQNIMKISSGPFIIEEWNKDFLILAKNKKFNLIPFKRKLAENKIDYVEYIVYKFYDNTEEIINALKNEEIDLVVSGKIKYSDAKHICDNNKKFEIQLIETNMWEHIEINKFPNNKNTRILDLDNLDIRKALLYSIDRRTIMKNIDGNLSSIAHNFIYPHSYIYNELTEKYDYNPQKALDLFNKNGWKLNSEGFLEKNGEIFKIRLTTNIEDLYRVSIQEQISKYWSDIGIFTDIEKKNASEIYGPDYLQRGEEGTFDLLLFGWVGDPSFEKGELYTDEINGEYNIPSKDNGYKGENIGYWSNEVYTSLFNKSLFEINRRNRKKYFIRMQEEWVSNLPSIPLYFRALYIIKHKDLCNINYNASSKVLSWNSYEFGWKTRENQ